MEFDYFRLHELKKRIASKNKDDFNSFVKPHFLIDRQTIESGCKRMGEEPNEKNQLEILKELTQTVIGTAKVEWLFIDACYFESIEYKTGCTYGLSFVVDSTFKFADIEEKFDPKYPSRKRIELIRLVVYVDLAEFEKLSLCTSDDFKQYKDFQSSVASSEAYLNFNAAAKAARSILSEKSIFEEFRVVPVLSIKAKNPVSDAKKEIKVMRSALSLLSKVLTDEDVPLEGLVLGLELLTNPLESSKDVLKRDVYQNFYAWTEALPSALAVINIELNEDANYNPKLRLKMLSLFEEILKKPIAKPYFFNFCFGSFVFELFLNNKEQLGKWETKRTFDTYFTELVEIQRNTFDSN